MKAHFSDGHSPRFLQVRPWCIYDVDVVLFIPLDRISLEFDTAIRLSVEGVVVGAEWSFVQP